MNAPPATLDPDDGWGMTFAFWGTLLVAGFLFAAVSLAPKFKTLADLRAEYAANQLRLVELERRADELERVAEAIEHDPAFAAELAKFEFAAGRTGDERIAVPIELRLGADEEPASRASPRESVAAWSIPPVLLDPLATHDGLRVTLLAIAAGLTLVAFLALNEEQAATVRAVANRVVCIGRSLSERYRKA